MLKNLYVSGTLEDVEARQAVERMCLNCPNKRTGIACIISWISPTDQVEMAANLNKYCSEHPERKSLTV